MKLIQRKQELYQLAKDVDHVEEACAMEEAMCKLWLQ
jgi:hypothetical protein